MSDDINKRISDFNEELKKLLDKYELVLVAQAMIDGEGRVRAYPKALDARVKPEIIMPT